MLIMIDNYDSFTYNLVQYFQELGQQVQVFRNDEVAISEMAALNPEYIVISPGPCTPNEAGHSMNVIQAFAGKVPMLGVCLGHQSMGQVFGGKIIRAKQVMHGKTSEIKHTSVGVFSDLKNPLVATRYHSLVIDSASLPDVFEVTAWTETTDGAVDEIMGLQHKKLPLQGVQFHPESILTEQGHALLKNFLEQA